MEMDIGTAPIHFKELVSSFIHLSLVLTLFLVSFTPISGTLVVRWENTLDGWGTSLFQDTIHTHSKTHSHGVESLP